jgi:hypothetical protein
MSFDDFKAGKSIFLWIGTAAPEIQKIKAKKMPKN